MKMKSVKFNFILLSVVIVGLFCANLCSSEEGGSGETPEWLKRIDFGIEVETHQKPRGYFETVQPLYQDLDKQNTFFIQPRCSWEDKEATYNLGLGYRRLLYDNSVLIGVNSFFDYEDNYKRSHDHYRVGAGLEAFIKQIELRGNSYIGLSPRVLVEESLTTRIYEKAVDGFDAEIGLPIPYMNWIKLYGGGYWYNYELFSNKEGWKVRTEIKPFKYTTLNFIAYDDNKGPAEFRTDARVTIPFEFFYGEDPGKLCNIGFSKEAYPEKVDHSSRVLDRVEREYKIEVEKWAVSKTGGAILEVGRK